MPNGYLQKCKNTGTVDTLEYTAKDYTGSNEECSKQARVYLPYGYDAEKAYPVFYLMHGGGDDETWYFGESDKTSDSVLGLLLDHMIAGGVGTLYCMYSNLQKRILPRRHAMCQSILSGISP